MVLIVMPDYHRTDKDLFHLYSDTRECILLRLTQGRPATVLSLSIMDQDGMSYSVLRISENEFTISAIRQFLQKNRTGYGSTVAMTLCIW